ncbi:MAG TPA: signal peptidase I [Anaerolineaceae bacterium]|nr:signal peptidase I [Anaerolineaceae bacterium]
MDRVGAGLVGLLVIFLLFILYGTMPNPWYQVLVVTSGSMSPTFEAGDLIVVTRPPEQLEPGMVLTLMVDGEIVTHRLMEIRADGSLVTQGDANPIADEWGSADVSVRGHYHFRIPKVGFLLSWARQWLTTTAGR